jgi:hypothetical protein
MDSGQAREELEQILGAEEYSKDYSGLTRGQASSWSETSEVGFTSPGERSPSLGQQLLEKFMELLGRIFQNNPEAVDIVSVMVVAICVVALISLIVWGFLRMKRNVRLREMGVQGFDMHEKTWKECLAEADDLAAQKNFGSAVRLLFLAFILFLSQKDWIQFRDWKTNGQYLRELKGQQAQAVGEFSYVATCFEDTVYGGRTPDSDMYAGCRNRALAWMEKEAGL